ncbi:MAG: hypothetical protein EBQ89_09575 [Alphaproteobacteria bacterium]|nr:hypothetical protein [Alphaproteobacteria bacterium]
MLNKLKCLLIGYGNIAKIHAKYLEIKPNLEWYWYDPYIKNSSTDHNRVSTLDKLNLFDKIFILTPEDSHYSIYKQVRAKFNKDIFIEKPAIVKHQEIDLLEDPKVFIGLVERFNPTIETLKDNIEIDKIINLDFSRCCVANAASPISVLKDISIHDIDLFFYLTQSRLEDQKNISMNFSKNTVALQLSNKNIISRFIWSKDTFFKERKLIIRQTNCTYVADLQEQKVTRYFYNSFNQTISESLYVEKGSPINNEQINFLSQNPEYVVGNRSHRFLLSLLNYD